MSPETSSTASPPRLGFSQFKARGTVREANFYFRVVTKLSPPIAFACDRLGLTPNQVTSGMIFLAIPIALLDVLGARVWALLIFHAFFVLDCVDGFLARATDRRSRIGAYLDALAHVAVHGAFAVSFAYSLYAHAHQPIAAGLVLAHLAGNAMWRELSHENQAFLGKPPQGGIGTGQAPPWRTLLRQNLVGVFDYPYFALALTVALVFPAMLVPYLMLAVAAQAAYIAYGAMRVLRASAQA